MKLWIDDVRPAPNEVMFEWAWCKSVNSAKAMIKTAEDFKQTIKLIDIDHDAGDYANDGGDYIALLNWFEETGRSYPIRIHSMNPVGRENMRRIIQRNGWMEIM